MDLASAEKAIRHGAVAALISAVLSLIVVSISVLGEGTGRLEMWSDPLNFFDVVLLFGLAYGVRRHSRVAAIFLLVYFTLAKTYLFITTGSSVQIFALIIFVYFFGRAALGTFAYHRIRREQEPEYRPVTRAMYFVWVPVGLVGIALVGLMLVGSYEDVQRALGDPLELGKPVSGTSASYTIRPPDSQWVRVSPGTIGEDSDLELYGATIETWAVVYVFCNGNLTMDNLVEYRRDAIQLEVNDLSVSEERMIMPDLFLPVSYARYSGEIPIFGDHQIYWVAVVVADHARIEVVAGTTLGTSGEIAIESLVKSLSLTKKVNAPCEVS